MMNRSRIGGSILTPSYQARNVIGGKTYTPAATYPSSSNAAKSYTVCEVSDGTTSCDCMGWTRRNPPGGRTCKHTEDYVQFLRPLWNNLRSNPQGTAAVAVQPAPVVQAPEREKGGTLAQLLNKLEKRGLDGS